RDVKFNAQRSSISNSNGMHRRGCNRRLGRWRSCRQWRLVRARGPISRRRRRKETASGDLAASPIFARQSTRSFQAKPVAAPNSRTAGRAEADYGWPDAQTAAASDLGCAPTRRLQKSMARLRLRPLRVPVASFDAISDGETRRLDSHAQGLASSASVLHRPDEEGRAGPGSVGSWVERGGYDVMRLKLRPLHPIFVAEATGLDLAKPISRADACMVNAAMNRCAVLVWRNQPLTALQQVQL